MFFWDYGIASVVGDCRKSAVEGSVYDECSIFADKMMAGRCTYEFGRDTRRIEVGIK